MNWETILVALIAAVGSLIGTILSNRQQRNLIVYRMDQMENKVNALTDKVDRHNNDDRRLIVIETKQKKKKED